MQRLAQWATIICAFTLTLLTGCAPMQDIGQDSLAPYHPKLPADITTFEDARKDLALQLSTQSSTSKGMLVTLRPWPFHPDDTAASDRFFKMNRGIREIQLLGDSQNALIWVRSISVLDDRIELPQQAFLFDDLPTLDISVKYDGGEHIDFSKNISVYYFADAKRAADDLFFMQQNMQQYKDGQKAQQALFEAKAAAYLSGKVKAEVTEEQRKFIIQANALTQERDYKGAIERYKSVLKIDPVAYPSAYYNMALLSVELGMYKQAIENMKKYLILEPTAKDARSAQDKIYEWEMKADQ